MTETGRVSTAPAAISATSVLLVGIVLGGGLGWLAAWEQGALFNNGLYPFSSSASALYLFPLTICSVVLFGLFTWLYGLAEVLYRHRREIILYAVTVAPFFSGVNLGPIDPSDPAFLASFIALVMLLCVEREKVQLDPFVFGCSMVIVIFCFTSIFAGRVSTIVQLHTIITKVLLVFIIANLIRTDSDMARFVRTFILISCITALVASGSEIVFLTTGLPLTFDDALDFHFKHTPFGQMLRATGFMASTQGLAHVMVIATAMTLTAPMRMWLRLGILGLLGIGCFTTFSAGSYVAMGVVYFAAPFILFPRSWIPVAAAYVGGGVLLFFTGLWQILLNDIMIPLGLRNFMERMEFIRRGMRGAENWPWTGNGIGNIGRHLETSIHNAYVQSVVDIGVIGAAAFTSILIYLTVRNWARRQRPANPDGAPWSPAMTLILIGISTHLLLEPFFNNTVTWLLLGVATANILASRNKQIDGLVSLRHDFKNELDLSLSGYLSTLYRMRFIIVLVTLSAGAFGYYFSKTFEARYEAVAQFYVPETATRSGRGEEELPVAPVPSGNRDGVTAAVSLLRTDELRSRVNALVPAKPFTELDLDVDPVVERSSMVHVYVRDADPQIAADVANAYFEAFVTFVAEQQTTQQADALSRTVQRLAELDREIDSIAQTDRDRMERLLSLRDTLTTTQQNLERRSLSAGPAAIMASPATPPEAPVFPVLPLNVVVSVIAGLVLGIIYAVLLDHIRMNRRRRRYVELRRDAAVMELLDGDTAERDVPKFQRAEPDAPTFQRAEFDAPTFQRSRP